MKRSKVVGRVLSFLIGFALILAIIPGISFAEWAGGEWEWEGDPIYSWQGGEWVWESESRQQEPISGRPLDPPACSEGDSPNGETYASEYEGRWVFQHAEWIETAMKAEPARGRPEGLPKDPSVMVVEHAQGRWYFTGGSRRPVHSGKEYTVIFDANGGHFGRSSDNDTVRITVKAGERIGRLPSSPKRGDYDFDGWETSGGVPFTSRSFVLRDNMRVYADWNRRDRDDDRHDWDDAWRDDDWDDDDWDDWRYNDRDRDRPSSSRPSTPRPDERPTISSNVTSSGAVDSSVLLSEAKAALKKAGSPATVNTRNATSVTVATLRSLADAAYNAGKSLVYQADTMRDYNTIDVRLYIDPAAFYYAGGTLKLGASTSSAAAREATLTFSRWFRNDIAVVSFTQQGAFGVPVHVAALADLDRLNTASLLFYAYDRTNYEYQQIMNPNYTVDSSGYVHFYTKFAGDIIITDEALKR